MTLRIVYYLVNTKKSCCGAAQNPKGNPDPGVLYLQALDELVWNPGEYEAKTTVCLHVYFCLKKYQGDR